MQTITIDTGTHLSKVLIGEQYQNFKKYLKDRKTIVILDANIQRHYGDAFKEYPVIEIGLGEKNKTMATLDRIFSKLVEFEADRSTFILAVGGGIVCDVAGFAASLYMRGLPFGFISTTLLSQVDASVGGKNGVNFQGYKNMIGVFNQPEFVICDPAMLHTLERKEYIAGMAEIVKAGAIKNEMLFTFLENHYEAALAMDPKVVEQMVYESVKIKAEVVKADEREKGERRKLNFGHTFAHSLEKQTQILHGEAVAIGMAMAAKTSEKMGLLKGKDVDRIINLLQKLKLPVDIDIDKDEIYQHMKMDKKREGGQIHLVLLESIGNATIQAVSFEQLKSLV